MRTHSLFVLVLLLTGCAAQVVSSSARTVVVRARVQDAGGAQVLADAECKKYDRFARMTMRPGYGSGEYIFDCVQ